MATPEFDIMTMPTVKGRILDRPLLTGYIASVAEIYQQRNTDISIYDKDTGNVPLE
jgi:hypothetical protein